MKRTPLAGAISSILSFSAFCATSLVFAQDQGEAASEEGDEVTVTEEVVVTGSRIRKDVFTSSVPLDIIDVGEASIAGIANVGQLLQANTVALGSPQVTSATSFQFVQNGGLGANTISLRGLGANRTLVLLNGRRAGPAGIKGGTSSFDLNVLPLATIERVEILKDGASSIYGSDAVAGVINIITKKEDGASFDAFTSMPTESGGEESRLTASWGKEFNNGTVRVTADSSKRSHLRRGERDYFTCGNQFIFDQDTGERADIIDPRTGERACEDLTWGHVWIYDYSDPSNVPSSASLLSQYDYAGDNLGNHIPPYASPTHPGQLTAPAGFFPVAYDRLTDGITNDDHPFQNRESLNPQTELTTVYAEAEYHFSEDTTVYSELLLNRRKTESDGYRQYWSYIYTGDFDWGSLGSGTPGGGSPYSASQGWFGDQWLSPTAITDHNDSSAEIDYMRFVAGLRGKINEDWDWDLSVQYSDSDASYTDDRIYADSIFDNTWATS
jgi:iron complex outermembrane receptor protein